MATAAVAPVLELSGIHKAFPGVKALSEAGLRLYPGEVHTLMGQNGAGKSTLIKVLTGVHAPDQGSIVMEGREIRPSSTLEAQELGISTVYQEVNLCPNLSVAENIFIGRYPRKWGMVDWAGMRTRAAALLRELEIDIDVSAPLSRYPLAIQQMVAISRALNISSRVLVLDEPTSSLDEAEVQLLFRVLRRLREQGMAILFVTHFLDQTYAISDRITVMRNGEREGEYAAAELSRLALVNKMIGKPADAGEPDAVQASGEEARREGAARVVLETRGLGRKGVLQPVTMQVREGEVLGLAGLLGAGRTELARLLFGADRADKGDIVIGDKAYGTFANPRQAIAAGIGFCSEDRKLEGDPVAVRARKPGVGAASPPGHAARHPHATPARTGGRIRQGARHQDCQHRNADRHPVRRQPAESPAGPLAGHRSALDDPGRTNARHRRARQAGNHGLRNYIVQARHVAAVYLVGAARSTALQRPHDRHARPCHLRRIPARRPR